MLPLSNIFSCCFLHMCVYLSLNRDLISVSKLMHVCTGNRVHFFHWASICKRKSFMAVFEHWGLNPSLCPEGWLWKLASSSWGKSAGRCESHLEPFLQGTGASLQNPPPAPVWEKLLLLLSPLGDTKMCLQQEETEIRRQAWVLEVVSQLLFGLVHSS